MFWRAKRSGKTTLEALHLQGLETKRATQASTIWIEEIEGKRWLVLDELFPDVFEALKQLGERNSLILLSARRDADALFWQLKQLGLSSILSEIITVPPTQAIQRKAEALVSLQPAVFVGDTESDLKAAQQAEIPFIAVSCGQRSKNYLRKHGANDIWSKSSDAFQTIHILK